MKIIERFERKAKDLDGERQTAKQISSATGKFIPSQDGFFLAKLNNIDAV